MRKGIGTVINLEMIGERSEPYIFEYDQKDCILYALGIGAQQEELPFIYEGAHGGLKVFPTFGVIPAFEPLLPLLRGLNVDLEKVLHGEHRLRLYGPIPACGRLFTVAVIKGIYDMKRMAHVVATMETKTDAGKLVFENEFTLFCLGEGGFGGSRPPASERINPPRGMEPSFRASYFIPLAQAALYRLTGDINPIHIDPETARRAGLERPILHGLCSLGYCARALVHGACRGDPAGIIELKARFSGVVYPGDTLTVEAWKTAEDLYVVQVRTERGVAINQAYARVRIDRATGSRRMGPRPVS